MEPYWEYIKKVEEQKMSDVVFCLECFKVKQAVRYGGRGANCISSYPVIWNAVSTISLESIISFI